MAQGLGLLLPLLLGLLQRGRGGLHVEPPEPVVAVPLGGARQLTCRLACARPGVASVQWRGLDTSLGAVQSGAGSSVLSVRNASLAAAGTRVCVGSCGNLTFQRAVRLLVFAFPDQLTVSPVALVAGRAQEVACTAHNVSPAGPDTLSLSLLLGGQELEGVQALGQDVEEESQDDEDSLFRVTERWLLPPLGTPAPPALHCQATMTLPGVELSHRKPIPVLHSLTSREPPIVTSPEATPEQGSTRNPRSPGSERPGPTSPASERPGPTSPASERPGPTSPGSERPGPTSPASERPGPTSPASERPGPTSPGSERPGPTSPGSERPGPTSPASKHPGPSSGPTPGNSSTRPCHPEIRQSPAPGGLELLCEVACSPDVAVHWTQAPGGLAAYDRWEAGARAWLSVPWAECKPEGWFQCRLDPGGQVARLYLVPEICSPATSAALWTGGVALGLLLLAFLTYRLWKCCRPAG